MPNPKATFQERTSTRRAHDHLRVPRRAECPNCHEPNFPPRLSVLRQTGGEAAKSSRLRRGRGLESYVHGRPIAVDAIGPDDDARRLRSKEPSAASSIAASMWEFVSSAGGGHRSRRACREHGKVADLPIQVEHAQRA